jgi:hypothetical protein
MRPDASESNQISCSTIVRAARAAGSHPRLASVLQQGWKSANIVIRGIPVKVASWKRLLLWRIESNVRRVLALTCRTPISLMAPSYKQTASRRSAARGVSLKSARPCVFPYLWLRGSRALPPGRYSRVDVGDVDGLVKELHAMNINHERAKEAIGQ